MGLPVSRFMRLMESETRFATAQLQFWKFSQLLWMFRLYDIASDLYYSCEAQHLCVLEHSSNKLPHHKFPLNMRGPRFNQHWYVSSHSRRFLDSGVQNESAFFKPPTFVLY
ncbi:hypothetical protein M413DRAFT_446751 [Hebeloma cylindrosporum]|uniref:Uncharacterized protein n=1 Tax=Hebeloma cylindrosporum TaxID=76867 RepID=A0A0C2YFK5_HEBCY|nr:hypothetical protein M413DRAFT_446751 [Hebeloma cylindrosporum h7]